MLVVGRKVSDRITLSDFQGGEEVVIVVVETRSDKVRLGIDAPRHVQVLRDDAHRKEPKKEIEQ